MIIGILSMQKVHNHGSFLQSYALKSVIESFDAQNVVKFIDIEPGIQINTTGTILRKRTPWYVGFFTKANHVLFNRVKDLLFEKKYFPISGIDNPINESECDIVIIGSDEVFNYSQKSPWGYTKQLFGEVGVPVSSYAGSFGSTNYDYILKSEYKDEISATLKKMSYISVRDDNSFNCIELLIGKKPEIHLDPVFIFDFNKEVADTKINDLGRYIAIYCYDNGIKDEAQISVIKEYAKKRNLKLISLGFFNNWCDKNIICSPFQLLSYFEKAQFVVTDTFHGSVISIKKNRQFVTLVRKHNQNKLGDLLKRFNLEERIVKDFQYFEQTIERPINYTIINEYIQVEKNRSIEYLRKCLTND